MAKACFSEVRELRVKTRGKVRVLAVPSRRLKARLRRRLAMLTSLAYILDAHRVTHGFMPGRSPVTNAMAHRAYRWTLCADIENCFDSIKERAVLRVLGTDAKTHALIGICFHRGVLPQGFPTSPALCNIALAPLDAEMVRYIGSRGVYTRYADDITISANDRATLVEALDHLRALLAKPPLGMKLADRKTRVQDGLRGRRIITGVAVDALGVHPTRATKRRLRAAKHQGKPRVARGLAEWAKVKQPNIDAIVNRLASRGGDKEVWMRLAYIIGLSK